MKDNDIEYIVGLAYRGMSAEEISAVTQLKAQTLINIISQWRRNRGW